MVLKKSIHEQKFDTAYHWIIRSKLQDKHAIVTVINWKTHLNMCLCSYTKKLFLKSAFHGHSDF